MSKGQYRDRDRGKRRRGFDDDDYSPPVTPDLNRGRPFTAAPRTAPLAQGAALDAVVKMFNSEKGFGFVSVGDGSSDAFLHIGALQAAGFDAPAPGTKLKVQIGQGQKGPQVTAVLEVDSSTAGALPPTSRPERPDPSTAVAIDGVVKWLNTEKGFGFVQADDNGKDVFLHISVVEKAGLDSLPDGAAVSMHVVETQKGREAISISVKS
jgi:cold shock protein